ncbi:MAG: NAD(P)H-dependent oxidoreductase [bacterium]|nr:NAD(P)H-dependent oxidoreductase [bacterium]
MPFQENFSPKKEIEGPYLSDQQKQELVPEYLKPFLKWVREHPESANLPLVESGFIAEGTIHPDFEQLHLLKKRIAEENERRHKRQEHPISFVGIHASPRRDEGSYQLLDKVLDTPERLGVKKKLLTFYDEEGVFRPENIQETVEAIRRADGFMITTHTRRGILNSYITALLEALENENLAGKVVSFSHTFSKPEKDSQIVPLQLLRRFFEEKGCIILPYSSMYAHEGEANEPWLVRDIERNGVNFIQAIDRLGRSQLPDLLTDPAQLQVRKREGETEPAWENLQGRVKFINKERAERNERPLNVLFVLGGENPKGYSARATRVLEKNFQFLGLETDTINLAEEDEKIKFTSGNPEVTLEEAMPQLRGEQETAEDVAMQDAYIKLLGADVVIFTTPVRWFGVSARLQKFIERTTPLEVSGFLLAGKAFGSLITFSESGATEAEARLQTFADNNGMMNIPLGGLKLRLGSSPEGKKNPKNKNFLATPRYKSIRQMAAMGTALITEFLVADGVKVSHLSFDHLNPLLSIVSPED